MPIPSASDITRLQGGQSAFAAATAPGGSNQQVQYNNAGAFAGASNVLIENNHLRFNGVTAEPSAPAVNGYDQLGFSVAGRILPMLKYANPNVARSLIGLQTSLAGGHVAGLFPNPNLATLTSFAFQATTTTGTATARALASTNIYTRMPRLGYVSAVPAGSLAGLRGASTSITLGNNSGLGGFLHVVRFAISDATLVAGARTFVGISTSTAAPTNVEPSTLTNVVGVGHGAADTNLRLYFGGSVAQTPINLGVSFPTNTVSTNIYELVLYAPSFWFDINQNVSVSPVVCYRVTRINTGATSSGTLSAAVNGTQLPNTATMLNPLQAWRSNNASIGAVGLDLFNVYVETGV